MTRFLSIVAAALLATIAITGCAGMRGDGWQTLIDGSKGLENFNQVASANWRAEDGAIVADRRPGTENAFLVSKNPYKDFEVYVEFWSSDDANSGIYVRCSDARPITDRTCYEANIFDKRPDPSYGTGAIVHLGAVNPMPKAGGKWNTYLVTARGQQVSAVLNGVQTASVTTDGKLPAGPVALQYAGGTIKFRKVMVRPL